MKGLFFGLLMAFFIFVISIKCAEAQDAETYLKSGIAKFEEKEFQAAIEHLTKAIKLDPKNPEAYYYRFLVEFNRAQDEEALRDISKSIQLNPSSAKYLTARGELNRMKGRTARR